MQSGKLEPEVAFLNASLVRSHLHFWICCTGSFLIVWISWFLRLVIHARGFQVPDVFPVLAAALKALLSKTRESLTTRTLHSELVYNYSGSKHVIDLTALDTFALL